MNIHVVLVRSEYARNVGAAARAMANMGASRLILIDPRCDFAGEESRQAAAGAQATLAAAIVYASWTEFYAREGDGLRLALTRRAGRQRKVLPLGETLREATAMPETSSVNNIYLIFGPEADGLASEDLAYVNAACHLTVYGDFGSLNLAQAVLLALYQTREVLPPAALPAQVKGEVAEIAPLRFPDRALRAWLEAMGFDLRARRASAYLTLRRILMHNRPSRHELQVLEAILEQNVRRLREASARSIGFAAEKLADDGAEVVIKDI